MTVHDDMMGSYPSCRTRAEELIRLLSRERLELIFRHARATYPRECCGMVLASGIVRPCENAQDKLQRLDPRGFPRTSANAYCFDAEDQLFLAQSFEGRDPVRIVYHSHPDATPDFSETDRRGAMVGDQAIYSELAYLILRSSANRVGPAKLYTFANGEFQHIAGL